MNAKQVNKLSAADLKALVAKLRGPVVQTWEVVAGDCYEVASECGEKLTNAMAVETCLDANRMAMYGGEAGKEADKLLDQACRAGHYTQIFRAICRELKLA